jgi:hypothetical protein
MILTLRVRRGGVLVAEASGKNFIADDGLIYFGHKLTRESFWTPAAKDIGAVINHVGFFDAGVIVPTDTLAVHTFTEWTGYAGNRPTIQGPPGGTPSGDVVTVDISTTELVDVTAATTILGLFATNQAVVGDPDGDIWNGVNLSTPVPVLIGDKLTVQVVGNFTGSL